MGLWILSYIFNQTVSIDRNPTKIFTHDPICPRGDPKHIYHQHLSPLHFMGHINFTASTPLMPNNLETFFLTVHLVLENVVTHSANFTLLDAFGFLGCCKVRASTCFPHLFLRLSSIKAALALRKILLQLRSGYVSPLKIRLPLLSAYMCNKNSLLQTSWWNARNNYF